MRSRVVGYVTRERDGVTELLVFESSYRSAYENHAFHLVAEGGTPDAWEHLVVGDGDDAGFVFHCRWVPLAADLPVWRTRSDPMLRRLLP